MTIVSLNLPGQSRNQLVEIALQSRFKNVYETMITNLRQTTNDTECQQVRRPYQEATDQKDLKSWAQELTVKEVIDAWDNNPEARAYFIQSGWRFSSPKIHNGVKRFMEKLIEFGLTKLDWAHLYHSDSKPVLLLKEKWLDQSIYLLDTLSVNAFRKLGNVMRKLPRTVTIRELLTLKDGNGHGWERSREVTIERLRELGFTNADGPFIPPDAGERKDFLLNSLIAEDQLTKPMAEKVVSIALRRGWVH